MFPLLLPILICVSLGSAYQSQGLLGKCCMGSSSWCRGMLGSLPYTIGRMVFLQLPNLELSCNWWVPGLNIYPSLQGLFHKVSVMWVSGICGRLSACHVTLWMVWCRAHILSIPSCCKTWSMRLFLNSIPLYW